MFLEESVLGDTEVREICRKWAWDVKREAAEMFSDVSKQHEILQVTGAALLELASEMMQELVLSGGDESKPCICEGESHYRSSFECPRHGPVTVEIPSERLGE